MMFAIRRGTKIRRSVDSCREEDALSRLRAVFTQGEKQDARNATPFFFPDKEIGGYRGSSAVM